MKSQFRIRAKEAIIQAYTQRLFLIQNGKSKNFVTHDHCTTMREDAGRLLSDNELAKFLIKHKDLIFNMVPAPNRPLIERINSLYHEAVNLTNKTPGAKAHV